MVSIYCWISAASVLIFAMQLFIEDVAKKVAKDMRFFQLTEVQPCIAESCIHTVKFARIGEVPSPLDIVPVGSGKQIGIGQIAKIGSHGFTVNPGLADRHQGIRNLTRIGQRTDRRT